MTPADEKPPEKEQPKKKRRGIFRRYLSFLALVAGVSSAEKPWDEEDEADTGKEEQPPGRK
jgi:hypothetical protein